MPPPPQQEIPPLREAFAQFKRLLKLIRPYWNPLARGIVLGLVLGILGMAPPYLGKLLIDEVYPSHNVTLMNVLVGGLLAVTVAQAVMTGIRGYFTNYTTAHLSNATFLLFFNHLQHLRSRFFDEHRVGEIMSRFGDVRSSLTTVSQVFETLVVNGAYLILVPPFLFLLQWKLALVALISIPITALVTALSARVLRKMFKQTAEAYADVGAYQVEVLSHIRTLKVMAAEPAIYARASREMHLALGAQLRATGWAQFSNSLVTAIRAIGTALFTWYGWTLILAGEMTLGDYIAFTAYIGFLYGPLQSLTGLFSQFQQSAVSLGRMFEYLDMPVEQDPSNSYALPGPIQHRVKGDIELRDVHFGYSADKVILNGVSLHFPLGTVSAVVGSSGAGKSSVLRLVTRMEEPMAGAVYVDGTAINTIPIGELRRQMAVVWQEFALMQGTVWENLTMGATNPTRAQVDEAVRLCRLDELMASLPLGYETPVGEWGSTLSGGQRQRMALARAIVRDTPVLLLDEATSNVDMQTETEILRDLFAQLRGRTIVFVTHRVQTAALADNIYVIAGGKVADQGTHAELMQGSELYRTLHAGGGAVDDGRRLRAVPQGGATR
jgi:ABC-type bacteriocin/lantibiotic exporter with double-glycine peptidase domain